MDKKDVKVVGPLQRDLALRAEGVKRNVGKDSEYYVNSEGELIAVPTPEAEIESEDKNE